MDIILRILNVVFSGVTIALTVLMLLLYFKERRIQPRSLLLSAGLSLIMLFFFILLTGARLNIMIATALFIFGAAFGVLRAFFVKLYYRDKQVLGKYSLLSLLGWGCSYALAILLNSFDSALLASLGLAPLLLATGTQIALNGTLFLRRIMMQAPTSQAV
ncbi:MAG: hypothetical protein JW908_16925 [Anaerolineales bacterium]|nr:hypothetical protein [Anaerolineales bacterium]